MSATASPDEEYYSEYDIPEVNVPGATISTVVFSLGGLIANAGAFLVIRKKEDLHNSFGLLCLSHVIADFLTSLITLLWCTPCVWFM
ncbi:hypothetical protein AAVH_24111 [Aphelenchoides avenae]|nr:hypothetical protein AAVH_24111 [Aphelenchus avenae]